MPGHLFLCVYLPYLRGGYQNQDPLMRSRLNTFYAICWIYLVLDVYTFFGLRSLFKHRNARLTFSIFYILTSLFIYYSFYRFYAAFTGGGFFSSHSANIYMGIMLTAIVGKLAFTIFMLPQDLGRYLVALFRVVRGWFGRENASTDNPLLPRRRKFLTLAATALAGIPFSFMLYGITRGKYAYTVNNVKLAFKDLPPAFEGFRVVQISDVHAGSLDSISAVARGIEMVNAQRPDLFLFTGDLVNSDKDEIDPFIDLFNAVETTAGKFCVLGNHDYYGDPDDAESSESYWADFRRKYAAMGFRLLTNENAFIEKDGQRICLLGVENWGRGRWFPKYGDLDKALQDADPDEFCILMSHDPTHWEEKVLDHPKHVHLTLSGHTHGFQFGVNMPGFKWSPAQYRYKYWMGLYREKEQYLYVNRGFGFLAFPGRIGMWPEITVLELTREA